MHTLNPIRHLLPALLLLSAPLAADEITERLDAAGKAYQAGELHTAVNTLNDVIAKIQERMSARLIGLLPPPLEGWTADAGQAQTGGMASMITGTSLNRRYTRGDGAAVTLGIMADSPLLPIMTMALSLPAMLQSDTETQPYLFRGQRGTLKHAAGSQTWDLSLLVGTRLLVQLNGTGLADAKPLEQYLERLDLDALQKALTN